MAKVITTPGQDLRKIAEIAGGNPDLTLFDPPTSELEVTDVTQAQLDAAFATYDGDQANIDAATVAASIDASRDSEKVQYDSKRVLRGIVEALIDEINLLRQQFNTTTAEIPAATNTTFNDRTIAQARTAILNKIDNL